MCGITGCVSSGRTTRRLLAGLRNLEYRGYDSAGMALADGDGLDVRKREGRVDRLASALEREPPQGSVGIGHTRWSTHGQPSDANAHPHTDCDGAIAVVHNGIIENHDDLRDRLTAAGHVFHSETDTEVVPHLVEEAMADGADVDDAFREAVKQLDGSYAIAMVHRDGETVYATRSGSPLVFGIAEDAYYLASDVPAFLEFTDRVVYLEDGDVLRASADGYDVRDIDGVAIDRSVEQVDWNAEEVEKGRYDHYMLKEIHEQPSALAQTVRGRVDPEEPAVALDSLDAGTLSAVDRVEFVACGTSYHAACYGAQLLRDRNVPARAFLASEYALGRSPPRDRTLLVGVTQSGETADTLEALRHGRADGLRTLAVTNVVGSTAARECDESVFIRAGPEIGVAATKTFSSQVATLSVLAERLTLEVTGSYSEDAQAFLSALQSLPDDVATVLEDYRADRLSTEYRDSDAYFFIGRATGYPVALEGALKLKEISYEHAEGFPAGELKHGPLALVTPDTPVFAVCTGRHPDKLRGTVEEVSARDAPVVAVTTPDHQGVVETADEALVVPETHEDLVGLLANVELQLLSYHTATQLDRPVDKPRNLAKSVTVE